MASTIRFHISSTSATYFAEISASLELKIAKIKPYDPTIATIAITSADLDDIRAALKKTKDNRISATDLPSHLQSSFP